MEFKSYTEFNTAISPIHLAWWKYFQLRSAIVTLRNKCKDPLRVTYWDKCLLGNNHSKINTPWIYKELIDKIKSNFKATKALWSKDWSKGCEITEDEWNQIWIQGGLTEVNTTQNCA